MPDEWTYGDEYCPLCGANPIEHGEHYPNDEAILTQWASGIERLYARLQELRGK